MNGNQSPSSLLHQRFLGNNPLLFKSAIEAAKSYVSKLDEGDVSWLHSKPFDPTPRNPQYFRLMFDLLNILQIMQIPEKGRVLEIGCGPGWVTEILLMLGFSVDALEPSDDLITVAKKRCGSLAPHYGHAVPERVSFHHTTLEEVSFDDESFDAVLFFDVLHHVVDEKVAMQKCYKFLKHGGCIGIVEGAWHPEFKELEAALIAEMAKFGTLENPFSTLYLDQLLSESGFLDIERYVAVNGFFAEKQLKQPLAQFAGGIAGSNNMTARKPGVVDQLFANCSDLSVKTDVVLKLVSGGIDPTTRQATLVVDIQNCGETRLDNHLTRLGHVTLALRNGELTSPLFVECQQRPLLAQVLTPGMSIQMTLSYNIPLNAVLNGWKLDLVCEGLFWLSSQGIPTLPIPCLPFDA
jgi:SAM-dependent methyltransferase